MDYAIILADKYEGRQFSVGETYESIVALDDGPIPSQQELDALWPEVQHTRAVRAVEAQRAQAYRDEADPLFFRYQAGEATKEEWEQARQAVRDRYPYPEEIS